MSAARRKELALKAIRNGDWAYYGTAPPPGFASHPYCTHWWKCNYCGKYGLTVRKRLLPDVRVCTCRL